MDLSGQPGTSSWKILIVDDEESVHQVTEMVLSDFSFENRGLEFLHAYDREGTLDVMEEHPDVALILMDVVMETDRAGLDLVEEIRKRLGNHQVRIVLRTGQPGEAPEDKVITRYDINGYKEKTELTAQKLFTTVYSALRSYRDIMIIERNKRGLEKVIESSAYIFGHETSVDFASAVLEQVVSLLRMDNGVLYCRPDKSNDGEIDFAVAAATGTYSRYLPKPEGEVLPDAIRTMLREAYLSKCNLYQEDHCVLHFTDASEEESLLYLGHTPELSDWEQQLVELFCTNVSIAMENVRLYNEAKSAQVEMVHILAEAVESRSKETGNHVRRVAQLSRILAEASGMPENEAMNLEMAAPLHDVGKIGIPDEVLHKPGRHDEGERKVMQTHAHLGYDILRKSRKPIIRLGADVCRDHHENWDGSGYPEGRKGEEISLAGRIVAVADVFDALGSRRCYKEPWPEEDIREFFIDQRGRKFDPQLVDLLFKHWDVANGLREQFPD